MLLTDYRPRSAPVTKTTAGLKPRFPVIDAHNLAEPFAGGWDRRPVWQLLDALDAAGVRLYVDLDGGWGEDLLHSHLDHFKAAAPERFRIFGGVNWAAWPEQGDGFGEWAASRLRAQAASGAQGLKVWKGFGLQARDQHGTLVAVDDPRLDPLWATAGELRLPIVIHVADPVAFFDSLDAHHECWQELQAHPDWHFPSPPYPSFETVVTGLANLVARHAGTTFVGAHVGGYSKNLAWVAELLGRRPNSYVDIAARISEVGRRPYSARRYCLAYADRVLFGTDMGPEPQTYQRYYRFLETDDEYFNYGGREIPDQGRWAIHGLYLPEEVLKKIYSGNAERILANA